MQPMYYIGLDVHKQRISTLVMKAGVSYNKQKLHKAGYFRELLGYFPAKQWETAGAPRFVFQNLGLGWLFSSPAVR